MNAVGNNNPNNGGNGRDNSNENYPNNADAPGAYFYCTVCMERPQNAVLTPCGHVFCGNCIRKWIKRSRGPRRTRCPNCNTIIGNNTLLAIRESDLPPYLRQRSYQAIIFDNLSNLRTILNPSAKTTLWMLILFITMDILFMFDFMK